MASLGQTYNNDDAPPADEIELIPARTKCMAQVIESDVVPTKSGTGTILVLTFEVMEGDYEGRKIFERLNIANPNPTAQGIAQRALAQLCEAIGLDGVSDSEELHFKPVLITVSVRRDKTGEYRDQNGIAKYEPASGAPAARSQSTPQSQSAQPVQATRAGPTPQAGGRPWRRAQA